MAKINIDLKQAEKYLNERFQIAIRTDEEMGNHDSEDFLPNNPDFIFYKGCSRMIDQLGLDWDRDNEGNHRVY